MPPKKKARLSSRAASRAASTLSVGTPAETIPVVEDKATPAKIDLSPQKELLTDPWTDEQEISLFKGMVKWKPVGPFPSTVGFGTDVYAVLILSPGMHKHFRMLSLSQHLRNHGHNPQKEAHTSISGIWEKLGSLYNLKILDESEDSFGDAISEDVDPMKEAYVPFKLPPSDFGDLMFERRLAHQGSSSPPALPHQLPNGSNNGRRRPSVIDDSEGPRSSSVSIRGMKSARGKRGVRRSMLHEETTPKGRSTSKTSVEASGDGDEAEEDEEEEEEDERQNSWVNVAKKTTFELLDYFRAQGGNFIDTANNYQNEESETWLGDWMTSRKARDQMVVATKYSMNYQNYAGEEKAIYSNYGGNSSKSPHLAIEASLKKLQTSYSDILYVHWWDNVTAASELMLSLNALLIQGKILYLAISDAPAWFVARCNDAAARDFERDILLGLCAAEGMAIAPFGALGMGEIKTKAQLERGEGRKPYRPIKNAAPVNAVLEAIAERKGSTITNVALAYVMHKAPYVFPICGGRKVDQLRGNIEALSLGLSEKEMKEIEAATPFDAGFPLNWLGSKAEIDSLVDARGKFNHVEDLEPIRPAQPNVAL
ncbi:hypothetical protein MMC13_003139 [Lambiella insularis]|nr:hypothetical protein [Lambiella insularis]